MKIRHLAAFLMLLLLQGQPQAFQLSPIGTLAERNFAKRWGTSIKLEIALGKVCKTLPQGADLA